MFDKQVDNLRTNHRGVYVLTDAHLASLNGLSPLGPRLGPGPGPQTSDPDGEDEDEDDKAERERLRLHVDAVRSRSLVEPIPPERRGWNSH